MAFFAYNERYEKGVSWFLSEYFSESGDKRVCGEVSPQYMAYLQSAERIAKDFPDIRLIAILRNPSDRAYSAYRMQVRRGLEHRLFSEVVRQNLEQGLAPIGSNESFREEEYLRKGMYGAILRHYLKFFPLTHIHVVFTEDFEAKPEFTMRTIFKFLNVDENYVPTTLSKRFHEGGTVRFKWLPPLLQAGRNIVATLPISIRRKLRGKAYWLNQWNIRPEKPETLPLHERKLMMELFREDVRLLEKEFYITVPWSDFNSTTDEI